MWKSVVIAGVLAALPLPVAPPGAESPPAPEPVYRVGGPVSRPQLLQIREGIPPYTEMARKARLQGVIHLAAILDEHGIPREVQIRKGLPMGLDKIALTLVERLRFEPARIDGKAVKVRHFFTVAFRVADDPTLDRLAADHPSFAKALTEKRFAEAAALLDAPPTEEPWGPEFLALARCHLMLSQGRLRAAWELARQGERDLALEWQVEVTRAIVRAVHLEMFQGTDPRRAGLLDLALEVSEWAQKAGSENPETSQLRADFLREKVRQGDREKQALLTEVSRLTQESAVFGYTPDDSPGPLDYIRFVITAEPRTIAT